MVSLLRSIIQLLTVNRYIQIRVLWTSRQGRQNYFLLLSARRWSVNYCCTSKYDIMVRPRTHTYALKCLVRAAWCDSRAVETPRKSTIYIYTVSCPLRSIIIIRVIGPIDKEIITRSSWVLSSPKENIEIACCSWFTYVRVLVQLSCDASFRSLQWGIYTI